MVPLLKDLSLLCAKLWILIKMFSRRATIKVLLWNLSIASLTTMLLYSLKSTVLIIFSFLLALLPDTLRIARRSMVLIFFVVFRLSVGNFTVPATSVSMFCWSWHRTTVKLHYITYNLPILLVIFSHLSKNNYWGSSYYSHWAYQQ